MSIKNIILKRSQKFFEIYLTKQCESEFQDLVLLDIYVDKKQEVHSRKTFHTFVHVFKINESTTIKVDVLEHDSMIRQVASTGDYYYSYDPVLGEGDLFDDGYEKIRGLAEQLEELEYVDFFLQEFELLDRFISQYRDLEAQTLFREVKNSYPGLKSISYSNINDDFLLLFDTKAELKVSKTEILEGHNKAL